LGVRGKVWQWIESFLSNRRQRVVLRNGKSNWKQVISGVPQGSILSPILFLLFINDLPDKISSVAKLFADDSKLYRSVQSDDDCKLLQDDLNSLSAWSNQWLMKFNEDKWGGGLNADHLFGPNADRSRAECRPGPNADRAQCRILL